MLRLWAAADAAVLMLMLAVVLLFQVRVWKEHPQGVVTVKFKNSATAAQECVQRMNGRFFGGRQVHAALWGECSSGAALCMQHSGVSDRP